jgi:hypothetical protein
MVTLIPGTLKCASQCSLSLIINVNNSIVADLVSNKTFAFCTFNLNSYVQVEPLTAGIGLPLISNIILGPSAGIIL